jgi:hypothetical protein
MPQSAIRMACDFFNSLLESASFRKGNSRLYEAELAGKPLLVQSAPEDHELDFNKVQPFTLGAVPFVNDQRRHLRKDGTVVWGMRSLTAINQGGDAW